MLYKNKFTPTGRGGSTLKNFFFTLIFALTAVMASAQTTTTPVCHLDTAWAVKPGRQLTTNEYIVSAKGGPVTISQMETPGGPHVVLRRCILPAGTEVVVSKVSGFYWVKECGNLVVPEGWDLIPSEESAKPAPPPPPAPTTVDMDLVVKIAAAMFAQQKQTNPCPSAQGLLAQAQRGDARKRNITVDEGCGDSYTIHVSDNNFKPAKPVKPPRPIIIIQSSAPQQVAQQPYCGEGGCNITSYAGGGIGFVSVMHFGGGGRRGDYVDHAGPRQSSGGLNTGGAQVGGATGMTTGKAR